MTDLRDLPGGTVAFLFADLEGSTRLLQAHPDAYRDAVRTTKSLPIAQKQAGWSRLQMAYLTVGDDEVRAAMRLVDE